MKKNAFIGVEVHTEENLNSLIADGFTEAWRMNPEHLSKDLLRIWSLNDRGLYLEAKITNVELISTVGWVRRYRIYFAEADLQRLSTNNIHFKRNPVHYIRNHAA